MSVRIYNRTKEVVGALSNGAHVLVPVGDSRNPGYADVSPTVAQDLVARLPEKLGLDLRAAKQETGVYEPGFTNKHFKYLEEEMSDADCRAVLKFLSIGRETFKSKEQPAKFIAERVRQWMVGEPLHVESQAEQGSAKKRAANKAKDEAMVTLSEETN